MTFCADINGLQINPHYFSHPLTFPLAPAQGSIYGFDSYSSTSIAVLYINSVNIIMLALSLGAC